MYTRASITIGDGETESTSMCEYKEADKCDVGGCLAEVFAKSDCTLATLASMMSSLITMDVFPMGAEEYTRLTRAIEALQKGE